MDEKDLLEQLKTGKESAFKKLVELYKDRVFSTVMSITQNQAEAEDLSQEVFIEVYQSVHKLEETPK